MADHNLGSIDEDVPFAWTEASTLKHEFGRAADKLENQIGPRRGWSKRAKRDWRGKYSQDFDSHMEITIGDAAAARQGAAPLRRTVAPAG